MFYLSLIIAAGFGLATAFQGPTNAALSRHCGVFQAAFVSFTGGVLLVGIAALVYGESLSGLVDAHWWQVLGGIYGACIVASCAMAIPKLGAALAGTTSMVAQLTMAFLIDTLGWFGAEQVAFHPLRLLGCLVVAGGVLLVYAATKKPRNAETTAQKTPTEADLPAAESTTVRSRLPYVLLALLAGLCGSSQMATNASLATCVGVVNAGFVSFAGGWVVLLAVTLIANRGKLHSTRGVAAWKHTGGVYGAYGVIASIVATPVLGVGLATTAMMLASLIGSLLVDSVGLFEVGKIPFNKKRLVGAAVVAVGIVLISLARAGIV